MPSRIKCPFCGGMYRQNADGSIHGHGERGFRYPNCGGPATPDTAQCTSCRMLFVDGEAFDGHRDNGHCVHPKIAGYEEVEGVWRRIPGLLKK